jgi:hypothetical protein
VRRDPVCSCLFTDYRGLRLDANELWLHVSKKTSVTAINITLGVPGRRADKSIVYGVHTRRVLVVIHTTRVIVV